MSKEEIAQDHHRHHMQTASFSIILSPLPGWLGVRAMLGAEPQSHLEHPSHKVTLCQGCHPYQARGSGTTRSRADDVSVSVTDGGQESHESVSVNEQSSLGSRTRRMEMEG